MSHDFAVVDVFASGPLADWRLRSFTPSGDEVAGAGHNALGAWWWLAESGRAAPPGAVQELGGRTLAVRITVADGVTTIGLDQGAVDLDQVQVPVRKDGTTLSGRCALSATGRLTT